ncbi:hypothetical protein YASMINEVIRUS_295 [Yasminevirus sp. GU-2018]|uniref:Uncharacterized protein n=1 Tax=Yasminevirus sp. GU-2018 TaxID=2420051 RepID=A0A5K0U8V0_9VIRU|nr:hypothetical protein YASMINEVIRUS_295 [Yasminevirus sp. GU-2018]
MTSKQTKSVPKGKAKKQEDDDLSSQPTQPVRASSSSQVKADSSSRASQKGVKDDLESDITNLKKTLTIPVSDDTLDQLEGEIDRLNDTSNLSEKVKLHASLVSHTKQLEATIDSMVDMIDQVDIDAACEEIKKNKNASESTDVSDNVANLDKLLSGMKNEEVMQIKILYMKKIIDTIARCREACEQNKLVISKCN